MDSMEIQRLVNELPTRTVWAAKKGVGSFVTIDVGRKHIDSAATVPGKSVPDLHLWLHLCDWRLLRDGLVVLTSDSPEGDFAAALKALVGADLELIEVGSVSGEVALVFTGGQQFLLRENPEEYEAEDDMLLIYPYGNEAIGYRSDLGFYTDSELAGSTSPNS